VTKVNDLAGPLVYIANENEWLRLSYNKVTKDTLDHFWLQYTGNKEIARKMIKLYYQRVVQANEYYTEYKEGWKTDRGMVYVIMGRPDRISQNGDDETWFYKVGTNRVEFKFTRLKNKTKGVYYTLTRNAGLEKAWLETLDKWRRGAIE
jgi:GWxTD domain-containing protein